MIDFDLLVVGSASVLPPPDELEELDDELELLELWMTEHGGTITVVTPLLTGSTSWFWTPPCAALAAPPPGVIRIVLAGSTGGGAELELLELLLDEELCVGAAVHGWTATVSASALGGTITWFDPGGIVELPGCVTCASEHGGTTIVTAPFCFDTTTVRTPGFWSAVETGSIEDELLDELLLPPHALTVRASAAAITPLAASRAVLRLTSLTCSPSSCPC